MKIFKSFIVIFIFISAYAVQAQKPRLTNEERALVLTFRMEKYLHLTDSQRKEIMQIHQNAFDKMDMARQKFCNDKAMLKKAKKEISETHQADLQKVLSKDQFELFKQKQKEMQDQRRKEREARKAMQEKNKGNPPSGKPAEVQPVPKEAPGGQ